MSHYHHQNPTDGKLPLWRHGRAPLVVLNAATNPPEPDAEGRTP